MRLFVNQLTNSDFSYLHPERGLLGETWFAGIELEGALDEQGMICDFSLVKKILRNWLDQTLDHVLLVPSRANNLDFATIGDQVELCWRYGDNTLRCSCPADAVTLVDCERITPESVASWSVSQVRQLLPDALQDVNLSFDNEPISGAYYHYSHGLKKHAGKCQRIAHGHRSAIHIYRNGARDTALEHEWADRLRDIYVGSREDLSNEDRSNENKSNSAGVSSDGDSCRFAYRTALGAFELQIPRRDCYLLDTDSTVEWIASHIAERLRLEHPDDRFRVRAFEGAGKGALAEA